MSFSATVDSSGLAWKLGELRDALVSQGQGGDMGQILLDEARLITAEMMRYTPPFKFGAARAKSDYQQGRRAVTRDVTQAIYPLDPEMFRSAALKRVLKAAQGSVKTGDDVGFEKAAKNFKQLTPHESSGFGSMSLVRFDPALHQRVRNRRGGVTLRRLYRGTVEIGAWKKYLATVLARVGWMRSGWAKSLAELGGRAPAWISRHLAGRPRGYFINALHAGPNMSLQIGNYTPGIKTNRMMERLRFVLRLREKRIAGRIRLVMSGYNADLSRNMKLRKRVRRQTGVLVPDE